MIGAGRAGVGVGMGIGIGIGIGIGMGMGSLRDGAREDRQICRRPFSVWVVPSRHQEGLSSAGHTVRWGRLLDFPRRSNALWMTELMDRSDASEPQ